MEWAENSQLPYLGQGTERDPEQEGLEREAEVSPVQHKDAALQRLGRVTVPPLPRSLAAPHIF